MPKQFEGGLPSAGEIKKHRLKLLVVIADRAKIRLVTDVLQERRLHLHFTCLAEGTAGSDILDLLGIGAVDKALSLCVAPSSLISRLMDRLNERLGLARPGKGIAFTLPLSGVSSPVLQLLDHESRENLQIAMENEVEKTNTTAENYLILALINQGCSEELMAAARTAGATGGTVIHARRISSEESMRFFGIAIQAEKEIVAILTSREKKRAIMCAIGSACGMKSVAKGIFLALPVDEIAGMPAKDPEDAKPGE